MIRLERVTKTVTSGAERLTILDSVDLFIPAGQFVAINVAGAFATAVVVLAVGLLATWDVVVRKPLGILREQ